jgi:hypothetical protein
MLFRLLVEQGVIGPDGRPVAQPPAAGPAELVMPGAAAAPSPAGSTSKLWTPGSEPAPSSKKSALWTPGS